MLLKSLHLNSSNYEFRATNLEQPCKTIQAAPKECTAWTECQTATTDIDALSTFQAQQAINYKIIDPFNNLTTK